MNHDQIVKPKTFERNIMHSCKLLHTFLSKALPLIHKKRLKAVINAVESLLIGKELSLSRLGRHMPGRTQEKDNIHKMNKLLGNPHLHKERFSFYEAKAKLVLRNIEKVIISVDWSTTDKRKAWHILRASINISGRSEVIYEEVHPYDNVNNQQVHKHFLKRLKQLLPPDIDVIILTDAGFCNPWFKEVNRLRFDYIGRTKSKVQYQLEGSNQWLECSSIYQKATNQALWIGRCLLAKTNKIISNLVLYKEAPKGRICKNRSGKKSKNTQSRRTAARQCTPWVLVTSLTVENYSASQIVNLYKKRMQIEENFRDTKSIRYGFSLRHSLSNTAERIAVLLLIAMLATFLCWLLALAAKAKNLHYAFQANTQRNKNVLSAIYLGCQLVRKKVQFLMQEIYAALIQLRQLIAETTRGYL